MSIHFWRQCNIDQPGFVVVVVGSAIVCVCVCTRAGVCVYEDARGGVDVARPASVYVTRNSRNPKERKAKSVLGKLRVSERERKRDQNRLNTICSSTTTEEMNCCAVWISCVCVCVWIRSLSLGFQTAPASRFRSRTALSSLSLSPSLYPTTPTRNSAYIFIAKLLCSFLLLWFALDASLRIISTTSLRLRLSLPSRSARTRQTVRPSGRPPWPGTGRRPRRARRRFGGDTGGRPACTGSAKRRPESVRRSRSRRWMWCRWRCARQLVGRPEETIHKQKKTDRINC